ncbi:hypothetical protein HRR83_008052 [Exophiala dermatitidis]|uniref:Uncharacterized protein n=1 Tax=Exophiala dermatitidis TaxID=5970 RepID=A0AAN6ITI1_EXODE|nr:hypothetical protein HRR74_008802 [Exophiala dermatitidis]KAJ4513482.1 hypothetical protein HRR73_005640 [Exophiala dermatitidis]KAJ4535743.1 hypothetical protein HRR77_007689 [Exophiala dermatitidis]KAJ4544603.1 hypothetical protein HRR76_002657 [Exophiala dermatitidis]KAJ4561333.1 hypothetical protein HRR79_007167 [Exophiala dermatitidis]
MGKKHMDQTGPDSTRSYTKMEWGRMEWFEQAIYLGMRRADYVVPAHELAYGEKGKISTGSHSAFDMPRPSTGKLLACKCKTVGDSPSFGSVPFVFSTVHKAKACKQAIQPVSQYSS